MTQQGDMNPVVVLAELASIAPAQATEVFKALDKMNLAVISKAEFERIQSLRDLAVDNIEQFIAEFIKKSIKRPANLINFFPTKELATKIVDRFKVQV